MPSITSDNNPSMTSVEFEDPFKNSDVFGNSLDSFDIWDEKDRDDAFNPFGDAANAFGTETLPETDGKDLEDEDAKLQGVHGNDKTTQRLSLRKEDGKRRIAHSRKSSHDGVPLAHSGEGEWLMSPPRPAGLSKRDEMSLSRSSRGSKAMDRRPRVVRQSSGTAKPTNRRRSIASYGKEASVRNLVTLLNGSGSSLDRAEKEADNNSCENSKDEKSEKSEEEPKTEVEAERPAADSGTTGDEKHSLPRRDFVRSNSMKSRRRMKSDLTAELKLASSRRRQERISISVADDNSEAQDTTSEVKKPPTQRRSERRPVERTTSGTPMSRRPPVSRGLPGKSASFKVRRAASGGAALDGLRAAMAKTVHEAIKDSSPPREPTRGNLTRSTSSSQTRRPSSSRVSRHGDDGPRPPRATRAGASPSLAQEDDL